MEAGYVRSRRRSKIEAYVRRNLYLDRDTIAQKRAIKPLFDCIDRCLRQKRWTAYQAHVPHRTILRNQYVQPHCPLDAGQFGGLGIDRLHLVQQPQL